MLDLNLNLDLDIFGSKDQNLTPRNLTLDIPPCYRSVFDNEKILYVLLSGGRGSGKTRSIIRFFLEESFKPEYSNTHFLCLMEYETLANAGIKGIIIKVIIECDLLEYFRILDKEIINVHTSVSFRWRGARELTNSSLTARKSQDDKIKSYSLASLVWLEEAQSITASTLDVLLPTLREGNNPRLFASFNPRLANDAILDLLNYQNSVRLHVNIFDLPKKYQNEALLNLASQQTHKSNYKHVWLGEATPELRGMIFLNLATQEAKTPNASYVYAFLDPSFKGRDSTALSIIWVEGGKLFVFGACWFKSWRNCIDDIVVLINKFKVTDFAFEDNGGLDQIPAEYFYQKNVEAVGITSRGDKATRIYACCEHLVDDMIFMQDGSGENIEYLHQLKNYEETISKNGATGHDDAPDSLASAIKFMGI